jgi:hypothetical protein
MEVSHELVRVLRNNREGVERFTLRCDPDVIQPGERNKHRTPGMDIVGRFLASLTLPFIESAGRDQAAVGSEQAPEGWPLGEGLHPGIDHLVGRLPIFGPVRNQAPAHEHDLIGALGDDHQHHLARGDVVAGHQGIKTVDDPEALIEFFSRLKGESSAHGFLFYARYSVDYKAGCTLDTVTTSFADCLAWVCWHLWHAQYLMNSPAVREITCDLSAGPFHSLLRIPMLMAAHLPFTSSAVILPLRKSRTDGCTSVSMLSFSGMAFPER